MPLLSPSVSKGDQMRAFRRDDSGDTYVELLVTLLVVGLASVAIIGGLMASTRASTVHRSLANTETLTKSALEQAKYEIELAPSPLFLPCGSTNSAITLLTTWNSEMSSQSLWPAVPTPNGIGPYQQWISKVECYSATSDSLDQTCQAAQATPTPVVQSSVSSCSSDANGIVEVTVSVIDPTKQVASLSTLVRDPHYGSTY